jgi:hypothetical protein
MRRLCLVVLGLGLAAGCSDRPRAPALRDEPVYDNPAEGLRFLTPEGWNQVARADPPPDPSGKDRLLVSYQSTGRGHPAVLEVSRADLPESEDLAARAASPSHGYGPWKPARPPESVEVGGAAATRFVMNAKDMTKEVTAVRRGGRVYFFTLISGKADDETRQQARRVIGGATWSK